MKGIRIRTKYHRASFGIRCVSVRVASREMSDTCLVRVCLAFNRDTWGQDVAVCHFPRRQQGRHSSSPVIAVFVLQTINVGIWLMIARVPLFVRLGCSVSSGRDLLISVRFCFVLWVFYVNLFIYIFLFVCFMYVTLFFLQFFV